MRFKLKSGEPFAFAGLWDTWKQPDGSFLRTYTIVTTASSRSPETVLKRIELLKEAVQKLLLGQRQQFKETEGAAKTLDVKLQSVELERLGDLENAFAAITRERPMDC